jgi:hypothetical protein
MPGLLLSLQLAIDCQSVRFLALIILCITALSAQADFDETYRLDVGGSIVSFDSKITINSRDDSIDKEIDFEDTLGFDSDVRLGFVKGSWRMANRHRLSLLYLPIRRTSEVTTNQDFVVNNNIIKAGAYVGASFKTQVFDIEYSYSYYKRPNLELGISAGIYWMNSLSELNAAGNVILEGSNTEEFRSNYKTNQRLVAPLPLFGLSASYEINPLWLVHANARYFDVTVSDIDGRIFSFNVKTEYFFTNNLALGASLTSFAVNVEHSGVVLLNTLQYEYDGIEAYLVLKY